MGDAFRFMVVTNRIIRLGMSRWGRLVVGRCLEDIKLDKQHNPILLLTLISSDLNVHTHTHFSHTSNESYHNIIYPLIPLTCRSCKSS